MTERERILRKFISQYNQRNTAGCMQYFAEDVELRSTYVQELFPDSNGIIKGKGSVTEYLELLFKNMPDLETGEAVIRDTGSHLIATANNINETLSYYLHYHFNEENLINLIKSNLTRSE